MFIGGLNWDTTDGILVYTVCQPTHQGAKVAISEGLRNYFSQFGKVEACTIMRDAGGRSRCFAFLTFEDPASVNAVMVREHFLDGKIVSNTDRLSHSHSFSLQCFLRSTPSERSPGKNTNAQQNYSSADSPVASPRSPCGSSFPNSVELSIRQSCWIGKPAAAKDLGSFPLRMQTLILSSALENLRLMENLQALSAVSS